MQYFAAYRFIFESPKWPMLLLIGAVCQLVPIAGPLVLMGYLYSVIEAKHRNGPDQFPAFDFDQLSVYLVRGVWPFVASLVIVVPVVILAFLPILAIVVFVLSTRGLDGPPPAAFFALVFAAFLVIGLLSIVAQILALPFSLRAGLSQDLNSVFSMAFVRDFLGRVWKEIVLSMLFVIITAPLLFIAGFLMLVIGVYVAAVVMLFAQFHFYYQLYELYLQRGGTPIPLKGSLSPSG